MRVLTSVSPILIYALLGAGCSSGGSSDRSAAAADSAAPTAQNAPPVAVNSGANEAPDQQFLQQMSDHHQGLLIQAHEATKKGSPEVKRKANELDKKQDAELEQMLEMLRSRYQQVYEPRASAENQKNADALGQKSGADFDMTFQMNVVEHHKMGIAMIDRFMPQLKEADLRAMAEKMKADQQKDIQELQAKMGKM